MKKLFRIMNPFLIYMGISSLMIIGAVFLYALILGIITPAVAGHEAVALGVEYISKWNVFIQAFAAVWTSWVLWRFYKRDSMMRGIYGTDSCTVLGWPYLVVIGFFLCIFGNNLIKVTGLDQIFTGYNQVSYVLYSIPFWAQVLCIGILIPIGEEMVFRVMMFRRLRDEACFWPSALISAVFFGIFHGNVSQGVYAFVLGVVIAYVYEKRDNPFVPILIHAAANLASVVLSAIPIRFATPGFLLIAGMVISCLLIGFAIDGYTELTKKRTGFS